MKEADYKSLFPPMLTPVLINRQGATAKPLSPKWLICHAENFPKIIIYDPQLSVFLGTFRSDYDYQYEYEFFNVYPVRMRLSRQLVLSSKSRRHLDTNYEIFNKSRPPTTSSLQV